MIVAGPWYMGHSWESKRNAQDRVKISTAGMVAAESKMGIVSVG